MPGTTIGIESRDRGSNAFRGKRLKQRAIAVFTLLAATGLCVFGVRLAAQDGSPKPAAGLGDKAAQPPGSAAPQASTRTIASYKKQLDKLEMERESLLERRRRMRHDILAQCDLSPENAKPLMLGLERDRFNLQIALEPKEVQIRLLSKTIAEIGERAKKRNEADRVTDGLKKVIAARYSILANLRTQHESGSAPAVDVDKAAAELAEAEVRLALRAEDIDKSQGDGELERLNRHLRELADEVSLDELRLKLLDGRLSRLQYVLDAIDQYNSIDESLHSVEKEIEGIRGRLRQLD